MSPKTQKRYLSRVYGIQNSVEKHMQGYARHHDTFKGYNLNLNQHLEENQKYSQDNCYRTKYNFNDNKISIDKQYKSGVDKTVFTHHQLFNSDQKFTDNSKIDF